MVLVCKTVLRDQVKTVVAYERWCACFGMLQKGRALKKLSQTPLRQYHRKILQTLKEPYYGRMQKGPHECSINLEQVTVVLKRISC